MFNVSGFSVSGNHELVKPVQQKILAVDTCLNYRGWLTPVIIAKVPKLGP
jgi:hypothetical protein